MARAPRRAPGREVPALAGCEINDDPLAPICQACRLRVAARGRRRRRSPGSRATAATARSSPRPDITIADLIGEVDPIKVAEGRYLADELTIHYGLLPRTNRGIFTINELPDLAERIQVGLLNIMEERDVQIRGYKVRLPLDLLRGRQRQPGGLHQPGPHHHAAQGPLRVADPHPLPAPSRRRDRDHGSRAHRTSPPTASRPRRRST